MWPRSARVERPFPTLSIPCGCETYPRDLLVDCGFVQEGLCFGLRKALTSQWPPLVVTLWLSFLRRLFLHFVMYSFGFVIVQGHSRHEAEM